MRNLELSVLTCFERAAYIDDEAGRKKLLTFVIVNWIWDYIFFERSVRLILPGCCDNPNGEGCLRRGRCG